MRMYYIYLLTNFTRTVLYAGTTNDLRRRLYEHKNGLIGGFTQQYHANILVYYETFSHANDAIAREKQIKGWTRAKKNALVEAMNPGWDDLTVRWKEED